MASVSAAKQGVSLISNENRSPNGFDGGQESIIASGAMGLPANLPSLELTYQAAIAKHRRGDLVGAEQDYRNVLTAKPDHAGAWHFLGMLFFARHQTIEALAFLEKALQLCTTKAEDYVRLAVRLGTDSDYREDIHRKILERSRYIFSPMDTVRGYENFFERICSDY